MPFSEPARLWFEQTFSEPTRVQRLGWPAIAAGRSSLLVAPTGSGKTLAAFLWAIDQAMRLPEEAPPGVRVVYVSPLKALVYDIERNLRAPLIGIQRTAEGLQVPLRQVGVDVRTGDTPQRERERQIRRPAEILVTTPESLFLMLGSRAAATFATVTTVIVDEIHVFAATKRGAHLALSLERLAERAEQEPQRVGLSATVRPIEEVGRFLGGDRAVELIDAGDPPRLELGVVAPVPDMDDVEASTTPSPDGGAEVGWPRGVEVSGLWPRIYPEILDLVLLHRTTIVFVNSRSLCERLAQRLNELWRWRRDHDDGALREQCPAGEGPAEDLVRAHHGSVSLEVRAEIEEALKGGRLRGLVATSSLELGIDMGAVDLVVLVESPGSVARGLQRVGRAGHGVGEVSRGVLFPKFKGDLLECAVVSERMLAGEIESLAVLRNPLDVLAQQVVAMCIDHERPVSELLGVVRRAYPFRELSEELLRSVLDMVSGRYPSDDLADLRPAVSWDRKLDVVGPRRGTRSLVALNAGTIPDRGLFAVHLGEDGPKVGELDEEMVYESRSGDTFVLGATSWRVTDITRDRVVVTPAPGEPARMPFWHGDGPGRPIELGRALGAFVREYASLDESQARTRLAAATRLDANAIDNLVRYFAEQRLASGVVPHDRLLVIERFRDELGDWRVCLLSPFGSRVHAPWALALERLLGERAGFEVETMYTDDGIALRLADTDELPDLELLLPDPDEVEDLIVEQVGSSALFAARFRENAARALLLPRRRARKRNPLWQQRLRAKNLLASVRRHADFPIVLESYRECLQDVFDVPALVDLLSAVGRREVRVAEVETAGPSPFARSLVFAYVAQYLYEQDAPAAERRAQALTLDRNLLRDLLGHTELRELLEPSAVGQVEAELQGRADDRLARDADEVHDLLRRVGHLESGQLARRCAVAPAALLEQLVAQRRAVAVRLAGREVWIAAEDAGRYREALGAQPPAGLPEAFLDAGVSPLRGLVLRFARWRGPFSTSEAAQSFGLEPGQIEPVLTLLMRDDELVRGEIRPGRSGLEWCHREVLRRLKRQSLAVLRGQVAPVESAALGRFLPVWHRLDERVPMTVARSRGVAETRLLQAIDQLEGLAVAWSVLSTVILPQRVPGFELSMLDGLAVAGELVWVGCGALGARDGRVALYRREHAEQLLQPPPDWQPPSEAHRRIVEHLDSRGACFTVELERLDELAALPAAELEAAIWDLVWASRLTNDTFLPLRSLGRGARRTGGERQLRARAVRRRQTALAGGRWSLVKALRRADRTPTEWAHATVQMLLERYGVVARESALAEDSPGGFEALYPVLRAMEESGQVRRGYFVEGLSGRQFALAGAVDRLRASAEEDAGWVALAAVDPANPWGSLLPWPPIASETGPRPRRVAGAWVLLRAGVPVLYLERGGRSIVTFPGEHRDGEEIYSLLLEIAKIVRRRSLRIGLVDGVAAAATPLGARLLELGATPDGEGIRLSR